MSRYDIALLDADGTLFDFDRAQREALYKTLVQYGVHVDSKVIDIYTEINERLWRQHENGEISKSILLKSRFARFFKALGLTGDSDRCNEEYLENLAQGAFLLPDALELCQALAPHVKLYIATNGVSDTQKMRLQLSAVAPYISGIFISEEIGAAKPAVAFFDAVFKQLSVMDRSRTILLGDSLTADMRGAQNAGLVSCWFSPDKQAQPGDVPIHYRITHLLDFVPIVVEESRKM